MATVTTNTPTSLTQCKFTGNGSHTGFSGESSMVHRGFIWKQGSSGDPTYYDSYDQYGFHGGSFDGTVGDTGAGWPDGSYSKECNGFIAGTSYRYRALVVVVSMVGGGSLVFYNYYGTTQTVTMSSPAVAPTVTTQAASAVSYHTCTGNGTITYTGGELCTQRGFCYKVGTSGDPTILDTDSYDSGSFSYGAYTKAITGLNANTSYRIRAFAINSKGTSYGTTVQITTTALTLSLSDSASLSDSRSRTFRTTKADSITSSDSHHKGISITLAASISSADSKTAISTLTRSLSDVATAIDNYLMTFPDAILLTLSDIVLITDVLTKNIGMERSDVTAAIDTIIKSSRMSLVEYLSSGDSLFSSIINYGNSDKRDRTGSSGLAIYSKLGDGSLYMESDIHDFGILAIKTLEGINIMGSFPYKSVVEVMVKWRNEKRGEFRDTKWKRCSPEGFCSPMVSGVEFKICIRIAPATDVSIDSLIVNWKISDKRFIRGMYNVTGSQT